MATIEQLVKLDNEIQSFEMKAQLLKREYGDLYRFIKYDVEHTIKILKSKLEKMKKELNG